MNPRVLAGALAVATPLAIGFEGLRQYAYYDPPGILTVCYGSTKSVVPGRKYSLDECKTRLNADMTEAVIAVDRCAPGAPQSVLIAFGDAVYNIGPKVACDKSKSTAARYLAAGQWAQACTELTKWDKARVGGELRALPGLTKRRAAEREICLAGLQ